MEETEKILLNGKRNKNVINTNTTLSLDLKSNSRILPEDMLDESVNAYSIYLSERERSNKFRLIFNIRPYCTNVLFNPLTEIVKYEGSSSAFCLNFTSATTEGLESSGIVDTCSILVKRENSEGCKGIGGNFVWNSYEAVRDTQLSNDACGFVYHNGLDIFNNHILRNQTFKSVMLSDSSFSAIGDTYEGVYGENYDTVRVYDESFGSGFSKVYLDSNFNTIDDYLRDKHGIVVSESLPKVEKKEDELDFTSIVMPLHLYQKSDIMTFEECYTNKLIEDNGWYGFSNASSMEGVVSAPTSDSGDTVGEDVKFSVKPNDIFVCDSGTNLNITSHLDYQLRTVKKDMSINKVINSEPYCSFIDMYPTRNLFSFNPLWNGYRKRLEKNWNYCLTYPSSSTTREFPNEDEDGKTFEFFNEISGNSGETTIALKAFLYDEYQVFDDGTNALTIYSICQHGLQNGDTVNIYKGNEVVYDSAIVLNVVDKYIFQVAKEDFNISSGWVTTFGEPVNHNAIPTNGKVKRYSTDDSIVSFKRIVNGVECDYYVRIFSRLPNFKFADKEINDYTLYGKKPYDLIKKYSSETYDFENHINSLGFARTAYEDDDVELVYTDNIDTSYLKDNLGRPLSDIFLTIVKNNKGYKEWYGNHNLSGETVEYSHCFGKVNCGFQYCDFYESDRDIRKLNSYSGNGLTTESGGTDEIDFYKNTHYYGDIVCYSPIDCDEQVIQKCMHRFNTVQRELSNIENFDSNWANFKYDEVVNDENSIPAESAEDLFNGSGSFKHSSGITINNMLSQDEGYYYQAHYTVPLKTISQSLSYANGQRYDVFSCVSSSTNSLIITTVDENDVKNGDVLTMYDKTTNKIYFLDVDNKGVKSSNTFRCFVKKENGNKIKEEELIHFFKDGIFRIEDLTIVGRTYDIPTYAKVIKDGSCRYCWREILPNGIEDDEKIYTFTNGAFYITTQINFYLRRQNPDGNVTQILNYPPKGEKLSEYPSLDSEEYYEEGEIEGC